MPNIPRDQVFCDNSQFNQDRLLQPGIADMQICSPRYARSTPAICENFLFQVELSAIDIGDEKGNLMYLSKGGIDARDVATRFESI